MATEPLLKAAEIGAHLNFPESYIKALARRRKIPVVKITQRCHRFKLAEVEAALARLNVKSLG